MEIRDLEDVVQLDRLSFSLPWPESSFRFELEKNEFSRCWVAEKADSEGNPRMIGMIVIWLIEDEVDIATFAVHPDTRQQKVAQRLLAYALLDACRSGGEKAYLEVRKGNVAARTLYQKFGFVEVGIRKAYYQDNQEDAVLMNLEEMQIPQLEVFL